MLEPTAAECHDEDCEDQSREYRKRYLVDAAVKEGIDNEGGQDYEQGNCQCED